MKDTALEKELKYIQEEIEFWLKQGTFYIGLMANFDKPSIVSEGQRGMILCNQAVIDLYTKREKIMDILIGH